MKKHLNDRKAAHLAAFFLRLAGGRLPVLKLVKLMYLAEREHLRKYFRPITLDRFVSMPHGPVPTATYDLINGALESEEWERLIEDREHHHVSLRDMDFEPCELSELEEQTAREVWERFKDLNQWELRDWTHDHCPEWEDPDGSSYPIPYSRILEKAAGLDANVAKEIADEIESLRAASLETE